MIKSSIVKLTLAGAVALFSTSASAAAINQVDYFSLSGSELIDFESLAGGAAPGSNFDGIVDLVGASFAERFVGQTISYSGNSDVIGGTPDAGLSLQVGLANQNINIFTRSPDGNVMTGLGRLGYPDFNAIGEGAVSILFDNDQSEFGFQSVGGDLGDATFDFWSRDGSLIGSINPTNLGTDFFGFSREGGVQDIAGISIWNTDPAGIGFDDIRFDVAGNDAVPEPPMALLLLTGLLGLIGLSKRKA